MLKSLPQLKSQLVNNLKVINQLIGLCHNIAMLLVILALPVGG